MPDSQNNPRPRERQPRTGSPSGSGAVSPWLRVAVMIGAVLVLAVGLAGCNPQAMAQATQATQTASTTSATSATSTTAVTPAAAPTSSSAAPSPTASAAEGTPGAVATEGPRPTPTGSPPTDPTNLLSVFDFFSSEYTLVKRDPVNLDKDDVPEMLYTISGPSQTVTGSTASAIAVIDYDSTYREWRLAWRSDLKEGTANVLPAANRADGYNGGDILRLGAPVLALRTTTTDSRAHLYLFRWDAGKNQGTLLQMVPAAGGSPTDAGFEADLDLNVADLDGDGMYESVVADNLDGVRIWKWDGSMYKPEGNR